MQSGLVAMDIPTILLSISAASYLAFNISTVSYVFVKFWKYTINLLALSDL